MKKKRLNQKGEFGVFRLLIGAVLGLALLLVVLSIIADVEEQKYRISALHFSDGFSSAINLPNGTPVQQEDLFFKQGEVFTDSALAKKFNFEDETCILFFTDHSGVSVSADQHIARIIHPVHTDVFFDCKNIGACRPHCRVSFGKELPIR
ncbi:hypothetical protein KKE06_01185 [Candidatus Micrarchaeota archaeon]|nr:hypothetical protein [Candidatus Micrarchaeota archaeon]MBU1930050.1 hypothetical protein [Candidatus Micrarchaeota archaeon]